MIELHGHQVGVQARALFNELNLLTYNQYKIWVHRGKLHKIRKSCRETPALINYESLPDHFKRVVKKKYGDPYNLTEFRIEDHLRNNTEIRSNYKKYRSDGRPLSAEQIRRYTLQTEIFDVITAYLQKRHDIKQTIGGKYTVSDLWRQIAQLVADMDSARFPHKLPKHYRRLKERYTTYTKQGQLGLIHAGHGNSNSLKINDAVADWITAYYALPNKPSIADLLTRYNQIKVENNWPELSESGLTYFLNKPEVARIWTLARHGKDAWTKRFGWHTKRAKEEWFPNCYWAIDGTKLDWIHFEDNTLGMAAKLKINPLIDVYSEKILGWSFSTTEDHTDHFTALKMAVSHAGARPFLLTYDNQSGHKSSRMQELYSDVVAQQGGTHYPHRAYRKSNPIEQVFNRLQQQVLNKMWFSDGQSIKVRNENNAPNMDFIKANKHHLKTQEALLKAWLVCVDEWNNAAHPKAKHMTRVEVYAQEAPLSEQLTPLDMAQLFWVNETRPIRYQRGGLRITIAGQEHWFEVYDADGSIDVEFRRLHIGAKFVVRYDPEQLDSYIQLLQQDQDGGMNLVAMAQPKRTHQVVPALMKENAKAQWAKDYAIVEKEYSRDLDTYRKIATRSGVDADSMIEEQELKIKMGGDLPKEERSVTEAQTFLTRI